MQLDLVEKPGGWFIGSLRSDELAEVTDECGEPLLETSLRTALLCAERMFPQGRFKVHRLVACD